MIPQVGRSTSTQDLSFTTARRTLNGSSISLSGNLHPQQTLTGSPLYTWEIGLRNFANPVVKRWSLESPKPETVNADLSFFLSGFSLSRFRRSRCRETCLPDSRIPICRNSDTLASFDFSTPLHFCRDFGLRNIANPNAMFSELHPTKLRNSMPPVHLADSCGPTQILLAFGISRFVISRFPLQGLRDFHPRNPDMEYPRVNPTALVAWIYGPTPPELRTF
jgi:hypothetical protein